MEEMNKNIAGDLGISRHRPTGIHSSLRSGQINLAGFDIAVWRSCRKREPRALDRQERKAADPAASKTKAGVCLIAARTCHTSPPLTRSSRPFR
jgi:hypothetical protein